MAFRDSYVQRIHRRALTEGISVGLRFSQKENPPINDSLQLIASHQLMDNLKVRGALLRVLRKQRRMQECDRAASHKAKSTFFAAF